MSFWAVSWVMTTVRGLSSAERLTLLVLAEFANEEDIAFPRRELIADRCELSVSSVGRALKGLEDKDLIRRTRQRFIGEDGRWHQGPNTYLLVLPDTVTRRKVPVQPKEVKLTSSKSEGNDEQRFPSSSPEGQIDLLKKSGAAEEFSEGQISVSEVHSDPLSTINHQINHNNPPPSIPPRSETANVETDGPGEAGELPQTTSSIRVAKESDADWKLIRSCLPERMRCIEKRAVPVIAKMLRERLAAGWYEWQILNLLDSHALPAQIRSMSGLVQYRLSEISAVESPNTPIPSAAAEAEKQARVQEEQQAHQQAIDAAVVDLMSEEERAAYDAYQAEFNRVMSESGPGEALKLAQQHTELLRRYGELLEVVRSQNIAQVS